MSAIILIQLEELLYYYASLNVFQTQAIDVKPSVVNSTLTFCYKELDYFTLSAIVLLLVFAKKCFDCNSYP